MASYLAKKIVKKLHQMGQSVSTAKIVVLGLTFKENCLDTRNSKVFDLIRELREFGGCIEVHDPLVTSTPETINLGCETRKWNDLKPADVLICAVPHDFYKEMPIDQLLLKLKHGGLFVDIKMAFPRDRLAKVGSVLRL
jgi:UDP-N-acetyl-D-glucosamine/UDP-N-acetyl-D-galactosamine dehydrogenase